MPLFNIDLFTTSRFYLVYCHITTNRSKPIVFLVTHVRLQMELYNSAHGRFTILWVYVASLRRARPHLPALWIFQIMRYTIHGLSRQGPPIGQRGKLNFEYVSSNSLHSCWRSYPLSSKMYTLSIKYDIYVLEAHLYSEKNELLSMHLFTGFCLYMFVSVTSK